MTISDNTSICNYNTLTISSSIDISFEISDNNIYCTSINRIIRNKVACGNRAVIFLIYRRCSRVVNLANDVNIGNDTMIGSNSSTTPFPLLPFQNTTTTVLPPTAPPPLPVLPVLPPPVSSAAAIRVASQYLKIAAAYISRGDYELALKQLSKAEKKAEYYSDIYMIRAQVYEALGQVGISVLI